VTPVNFGGMTGRRLAVVAKFRKSCDHNKSFIISESVWMLTVHVPVGEMTVFAPD
jgi:hypothetical protein